MWYVTLHANIMYGKIFFFFLDKPFTLRINFSICSGMCEKEMICKERNLNVIILLFWKKNKKEKTKKRPK